VIRWQVALIVLGLLAIVVPSIATSLRLLLFLSRAAPAAVGRDRPDGGHLEIDSFVPRAQIDQRFLDTPYYVTPSEPVGQEAFAVIREAMRRKTMVALGRLVLSKRERVIALEAYDKGLLGTTLRYPQMSASVFHPSSGRPDCVAGHTRLELRNVAANYPFERSHRFPGIQPNSRHRDYSRLSCRV
jgi:hypothetical protein